METEGCLGLGEGAGGTSCRFPSDKNMLKFFAVIVEQLCNWANYAVCGLCFHATAAKGMGPEKQLGHFCL